MKFWKEISGEDTFYRPHTNDIQHPPLRFLHKWIAFTMFPYTVRHTELVHVAPVREMVDHWLTISDLVGDIECTSLVTRIANNLGLLTNASVTYLSELRGYIDYGYFSKAHMLRRKKNGDGTTQLYMTYLGYETRIPLHT